VAGLGFWALFEDTGAGGSPGGSAPYVIAAPAPAVPSGGVVTVIAPVTGPSARGDGIVVGAAGNSSGVSVTSVADSQGNSYAVMPNAQAGSLPGAQWLALNCAALGLSDTITVTYSGSAPTKNVIAVGIPGAGGTDQAVSASGSGTGPSVTSGSPLAQRSETALALLTSSSAGGVPFGWGSGWIPLVTVERTNNEYTTAAYLPVSGTGAVTASASVTSAAWSLLLLTLTPQQDQSAFDFSSLAPPGPFTSPGASPAPLWLPDFYAAGQPPLLNPPDSSASDPSALFAPGPFLSPGADPASGGLYLPDFYDGGQPLPLTPAADPTATDFSSLSPPGLFISPGSSGIWQPDFYSGGQPGPILPPDESAADGSQMPAPGPFISPGPDQASLQIWQPDFYDQGQPPAIAGPGTQDAPVVFVPPGPFVSPAGTGFWQPDPVPPPPALPASQQGAFMTFLW